MIDDVFVIDAIAHCLDFSNENCVKGAGEPLQNLIYGLHATWNPPDQVVTQDMLLWAMPPEVLARTLFLESNIDFAVTHHIPIYSWFSKGAVTREQNEALVSQWPHRFVGYAGVDPTQGIDVAIEQLDEQMRACPQLSGLKFYPAAVNPYRSFRLDDQDMFPLYERVAEHGIKNIAIHKAVPLGPVPLDPLRVDDVGFAAHYFPELNFEIVHAGVAFVEETAIPLGQYPNVYANLEVTTGWLAAAPGRFEEVLAMFLHWGGKEKIFFSSGAMILHPHDILEKFWNFEFSQETLDKFGIEQLTKDDKALMLSGNYARLLGLDLADIQRRISDDEFTRERRETGLQPPWKNLREAYGRAEEKAKVLK